MEDDLDRAIRAERTLERLGTRIPICVMCGEADPRCLEKHHVAGKGHGPELAIVCRNCHRKLSDDQRGHPDASDRESLLERVGHWLLGLGDLLACIAAKMIAFGALLLQAASSCPPPYGTAGAAP
jgi:hypothetical protein